MCKERTVLLAAKRASQYPMSSYSSSHRIHGKREPLRGTTRHLAQILVRVMPEALHNSNATPEFAQNVSSPSFFSLVLFKNLNIQYPENRDKEVYKCW